MTDQELDRHRRVLDLWTKHGVAGLVVKLRKGWATHDLIGCPSVFGTKREALAFAARYVEIISDGHAVD